MSAVKVCILILLAHDVFGSKFWDGDENIYKKDVRIPTKKPNTPKTIVEYTSHTEYPFLGSTRSRRPTTKEQTTTTAKPTTTTATPTTEEPASCNASLYNKHDLEYMINNIVNNSNLLTDIINGFYKNASDLRDKYLQQMGALYNMLENRPEHLKDILQGINSSRKEVESLVEKMSAIIDKYHNNVKEFQITNNTATQLWQKFEKNNKICELNCDKHINTRTTKILMASQSYNPKEYYCRSMTQINDDTVVSLKAYAETLSDQLMVKINNDSDSYSKKVNNVSNELRKYVLDKFGRNMYEILNLEDHYIHLSEYISNANFDTIINKIRRNVADINLKLITFEDVVDNFGKYCRTCNKELRPRSVDDIAVGETGTYEMLKEVIVEKQKEIAKDIYDKYSNILKPLDNELNQPFKTDFMNYLNKTQEAISQETDKQEEEFKNLKDKIDMIPLSEAAENEQESEDLLQKIENHINLINEFLKNN